MMMPGLIQAGSFSQLVDDAVTPVEQQQEQRAHRDGGRDVGQVEGGAEEARRATDLVQQQSEDQARDDRTGDVEDREEDGVPQTGADLGIGEQLLVVLHADEIGDRDEGVVVGERQPQAP
jgi:hypothetical protein